MSRNSAYGVSRSLETSVLSEVFMKVQFTAKEKIIVSSFLGALFHAAKENKVNDAKKFADRVGNKFCGDNDTLNLKQKDIDGIITVCEASIIEAKKPITEDEKPLFLEEDLKDIETLVAKLKSLNTEKSVASE